VQSAIPVTVLQYMLQVHGCMLETQPEVTSGKTIKLEYKSHMPNSEIIVFIKVRADGSGAKNGFGNE
jgi:hypothetical protein